MTVCDRICFYLLLVGLVVAAWTAYYTVTVTVDAIHTLIETRR